MNEIFKIQAFEYLVSKLLEWHQELFSEKENDLSILKILKLTFFISAVGTDNNSSDDTLLDEVFNNYFAMPYGHVESDVYTYIKANKLVLFQINSRKTTITGNIDELECDSHLREKIDSSISLLKSINKDLIKLSSFELVDLSHAWYSWQKFYSIAKSKGNNSESIPVDEIKKEDKIYQL